MFIDFSVTIRKIINATLAMVFRLIFKVGLKFILGAKNSKDKNQSENNKSAEKAEADNG